MISHGFAQRPLRFLRLTYRKILWQLFQTFPRVSSLLRRIRPPRSPWHARSTPLSASSVRPAVPARTVLILTATLVVVYFLAVGLAARQIYRHQRNGYTTVMERLFPYPAGIVNRHVIPLSRLRWEMEVREYYKNRHNLSEGNDTIEKYVMDQISNRWLYRDILRQDGIIIREQDIEEKVTALIPSGGTQDDLLRYLRDNYGEAITLDRFRVLVGETMAESAVQNHFLEHITVRHIIIGLPENPPAGQVEAARKRAEDVRAKLTDVTQFPALAKEYSDDLASRDKDGLIGTTWRGIRHPDYMTPEFEAAIFALEVGQVSGPIRSPKGWHLVMVDEKSGAIPQSLPEYTAELRKQAKIRYFFGNIEGPAEG
jgi:hypothetical protein